jgi:hypothetical protein
MKDYKLKQRNLRASHTLGWSYSNFKEWKKKTKIMQGMLLIAKRVMANLQYL